MTSWFFIEMAAKSALICTIALLLASAIRNRAAADRARVLRIGVGIVLALPLIDALFPSLQIAALPAPAAGTLTPGQVDALVALAASGAPATPSIWDDPAPLILLLWGAGALIVATRLAAGLLTLRSWTRTATPASDPVWLAALARAKAACNAPDRVRLLVADKVPGPLGWGLRDPVILIDADTYAEREEADAILAHEVAHIARSDWPALMATRLATTMFWFNPLVWMLAREAVQQAEEAADAHAAAMVEPTRYAETLLSWAQIGRGIAVPANGIAPARGLTRRVRAVLEPRLRERTSGSSAAVSAMLICAGITAPVAALELVEAARPEAPAQLILAQAADAPVPPAIPLAPLPTQSPAASVAPAAGRAPAAPRPRAVTQVTAISRPALEAMRIRLPQVPVIVPSTMGRVDEAKLAETIRAVRRVQLSQAELSEALAHVRISVPDTVAAQAQINAHVPDEAALRAQIRDGLIGGREGMLHGADGMERGADAMAETVRRFRDRGERERIIARERARGNEVTHDDLLEAADDMAQGIDEMRDAARQMRRSAREMVNVH